MSTLLLDAGVDGVLVGAGDPPAADERRAARRTGRARRRRRRAAAGTRRHPGRRDEPTICRRSATSARRPGEVVLGPAAHARGARRTAGGPAPRARAAAGRLPPLARRGRHGAGRRPRPAGGCRRDRLRRRDTGRRRARASVAPRRRSSSPSSRPPRSPPRIPTMLSVDRVGLWSTWGADRHRLRDRLRELRIAPWADATGDGRHPPAGRRPGGPRPTRRVDARLGRPAAGRSRSWRPAAAWAVAPAPTVALALVDVLRRPGRGQFALDHARILAPLGSIPDADERRAMVADLVDDLLAPLGTVVIPAGMRTGRSAGSVVVRGATGERRARPDARAGSRSSTCRPGSIAVAEFTFRDTVRLGARGRHFAIDVTGGLGGLVVDLRDVPLRLPDRADLRGELLDAWQASLRRRDATHERRRRPPRARPAPDRSPRWTRSSRSRPATGRSSRAGDSVVVGAPDRGAAARSAARRVDAAGRRGDAAAGRALDRAAAPRRRTRSDGGEYVFEWHGHWRVAAGDITDAVETPFAGIVRDVRPGTGITIRAAGRGHPRDRRARRPDPRPAPARRRRRAPLGRARRRARPARSSSSARGSTPRR